MTFKEFKKLVNVDDIQSVGVKVTGESSEFDTTSITANQVVKLGTLTFNQTEVG